jgi:hypothetical protein
MAFASFLVCGGAALSTGGHPVAIAALVGALWSWGIASNFRADPYDMPNYVPLLSVSSGIIGVVMLIVGLSGAD